MDDRPSAPFPPPVPPMGELIAEYWREVPLALALREVHRLLSLEKILDDHPPTQNILDVGVGDGVWWRYLKRQQTVYGVDISDRELAVARQRVDHVANVDISLPGIEDRLTPLGWPTAFDGIIANCSLEHVPNIDGALSSIHRLLAPGGWLVMFVPTPWWAMKGLTQSFLRRRAPRLAMMTSGAMNGFFQHWHLMDSSTWKKVLVGSGFEVESVRTIGNRRSEFLFRLGLPTSFVGFAGKQVLGRYPRRHLPRAVTDRLAEALASTIIRADEDADEGDAYEFAIRCRKPAE